MGFRLRSPGTFGKTIKGLDRLLNGDIYADLDNYGRQGVTALSAATPVDSGLTAASWDYYVERGRSTTKIVWYNYNVNKGAVVAILLQYGHGTGTGGFVSGYDYINPACRPVFDKIADAVWREVQK